MLSFKPEDHLTLLQTLFVSVDRSLAIEHHDDHDDYDDHDDDAPREHHETTRRETTRKTRRPRKDHQETTRTTPGHHGQIPPRTTTTTTITTTTSTGGIRRHLVAVVVDGTFRVFLGLPLNPKPIHFPNSPEVRKPPSRELPPKPGRKPAQAGFCLLYP